MRISVPQWKQYRQEQLHCIASHEVLESLFLELGVPHFGHVVH